MNTRSANFALLIFFAATFGLFSLFAPNFATATNEPHVGVLLCRRGHRPVISDPAARHRSVDRRHRRLGRNGCLRPGADLSPAGYLVLPIALLVATLARMANGLMIVYLRLQPFIATLATLAAYRGWCSRSPGRQLVPGLSTTPISDPWITGLETYFDLGASLGRGNHPPALVPALVLHPDRPGHRLPDAAAGDEIRPRPLRHRRQPGGGAAAGINTRRVIVSAYALSGFCAESPRCCWLRA